MYYRGQTYKPYTFDDNENDMWVGEIDYDPGNQISISNIRHGECIEVRAETELILNHRVNTILNALNGTLKQVTLKVKHG